MKKIVHSAICLALALCLCFGLIACGVAAESIELSATELVLESGEEAMLDLDVFPENGRIEFVTPSERLIDYTVENGKLIVKAHSAGTGVLTVRSPDNDEISASCAIAVKAPDGYDTYRADDVKFVYPSSWNESSFAGAQTVFQNADGSINLNLVSEKKSKIYFAAKASLFEKTIQNAYKEMGYTVSDVVCFVEKYENKNAMHVVLDYTLSGVKMHQEQFIRNSQTKTYILTLTVSRGKLAEELAETLLNEFVAW